MAKLIAILSRWIIQKLAILLAILVVLLVGAWLRMEWVRLREDRNAIATKEEILRNLSERRDNLERDLSLRRAEWDRVREGRIAHAKKELEELEAEIRENGEEWSKKLAELNAKQVAVEIARSTLSTAETQLGKRKEDYGKWPRLTYHVFKKSKQIVDSYEKAEKWVSDAREKFEKASAECDESRKAVENSPAKELNDRHCEKEAALKEAENSKTSEQMDLEMQVLGANKEISEFEQLIESEKKRVSNDPKQRLLRALQTHLPTAFWILLGIILTPIAIKAVFYFGLAPLAARFPPIRLAENSDAPSPTVQDSSVSIPLEITNGSEILVHPDYLQSCSQPAFKRTQWLLNRSVPLSSIASGMVFLTRIRPSDDRVIKVIVSSQNDAFGEIGAIHLPDGASMVVQPRSLAGVVKPADIPVRITRHWRLSSLHAWLTMQLRFLVFHGPCDLILKGCRGVRAEVPDRDHPRMINQASTIGFSANLDYHNTRCETFISYLRGKEDLFNDLFGGHQGVFVYEEMPEAGRKTGLTGRGLEGVVDAALKVFGV